MNNGLVSFPFPLRPDQHVRLHLPLDLTGDEAERLCVYIKSLATADSEGAGA